MNYIAYDKRTLLLLEKWANPKEVLTPRFFFWTAGDRLQKSVEGFLRSILYQILDVHRALIPVLRLEGYTAIWTEGRLRECFLLLIQKLPQLVWICLFIDGVDELDGNHRDFLRMIRQITENSNIKCCFSSRPERPFEEFQCLHSLKLQDLTRDDIRGYIEGNLEELSQVRSLSSVQVKWKEELKTRIAERADGVFLWVALVLKRQINGIEDHDSPERLQEKLFSLPADVEDLYLHMLDKIDEYDQKEAAKYLVIMYYFRDRSFRRAAHILNFAVGSFAITDELRLSAKFKRKDITPRCSEVYNRILATCSGLLETYDFDENECAELNAAEWWLAWKPQKHRSPSNAVDWSRKGVRFLHRSAVDFLGPYGKGKKFIERQKPFSAFTGLLGPAIHLARLKYADWKGNQPYVQYHLLCFMDLVSWAHPISEDDCECSRKLFEYYEGALADLDQQCLDAKTSEYWFRRWAPPVIVQFNSPALGGGKREIRPHNLPTDRLSLAALLDLDWYLGERWNRFETNHKSIDIMAVYRVLKYYSIGYREVKFVMMERVPNRTDLEGLMGLIKAGADPNTVISNDGTDTIWDAVIKVMYREKFQHPDKEDRIHDDSYYLKVKQVFLEANARHCPVLPMWEGYASVRRNGGPPYVYFDIDTDLLPLISPSNNDDGSSNGGHGASNRDILAIPQRPLHVYFFHWRMEATEYRKEFAMSDGEVKEIHAIMRNIADTPPRSVNVRKNHLTELSQFLSKMHLAYCPEKHYPEEWEIRVSDNEFESDTSDSSEDEKEGDDIDDD